MAYLAWVSLFLVSLSSLVLSDSAQDHWIAPDGSQDDFSLTFYNGDTLDIQWIGWDFTWTDSYLNGVTVANLYVTSYYGYNYSDVLDASRNISTAGSYKWKIDLSEDALSSSVNRFTLRFLQPGTTWGADVKEISSTGFIIKSQTTTSATAATTTTASKTTSSTDVSSTTKSTSTSTGTSTSASASSSSGLSTGAKAGVGVGAALGGLAVLSGLAFLVIRCLRKPSAPGLAGSTAAYHPGSTQEPSEDHIGHSTYYQEPKPYPQEMFTPPAELASNPYRR